MIILDVALLILVCTLLLFMIFAIPLSLWLFFYGGISQYYSFESIYLIKLLDFQFEVNMGLIFAFFSTVYILCFIISFKKGLLSIKSARWLLNREKGIIIYLRNPLLSLPLLSSIAYVASKIIHRIQESYSIPLGEAPISRDSLVAFLELSTSPLIEEFIFRILPIGIFLITYLMNTVKAKGSPSQCRTLKSSIRTLLDPEIGKRMAGLRAIRDHGFLFSIEPREWLIIILTSAIFSFSHYSSTWDVGKLPSSFIQGLIMGVSYVAYGFQAPILMHWFFNCHLYAFSLTGMVNPSLSILTELNEYLIITLGIAGLILIFLLGIESLLRVKTPKLKTVIVERSDRIKSYLKAKYCMALEKTRHISPKSFINIDFAPIFLALIFIIIRLLIINFPSPESGKKYYETGFVFDEVYYVKAARSMLRGESVNNEHPPLVKLFIMIGIILFGDNPVGWRFFPIIFSSSSIILLYILVLKITGSKIASLSTAILFASDIMAFNIGQIAMLDAPSLTFILAASIMLALRRYDLGGIFFGLALLCKFSSLFSLGILLFPLLKMIAENSGTKLKSLVFEWLHPSLRTAIASFIIFLLGIWIYDAAYGAFGGNPLNHLIYILNYHSTLKYQSLEEVIHPLRWINPLDPFPPIPYYVITKREIIGGGIFREYHPIAYYGIYSPLWWSIWIIVPLTIKEIIRKDRNAPGLFSLTWTAANFLPYVIFAYGLQRWVYPFYFYTTLPGLYTGLSSHLTPSKKFRILLIILILTQIIWFIIWFPVKPKTLIDLLSLLNLPA
ncbi:MAG: glycosyltransferase family 39 protein [Candidatus Bathyarchaeia archaeon]